MTMHKRSIIINYDVKLYPFYEELALHIFKVDRLEKLHEKYQTPKKNYHMMIIWPCVS